MRLVEIDRRLRPRPIARRRPHIFRLHLGLKLAVFRQRMAFR